MRHPRRVDVAIAAVVGAVEAAVLTAAGHNQPDAAALDLPGYALVAATALPLAVRTTAPRTALAATFVATVAYWATDYPLGPAMLALVVALLTVMATGHRALGWVALGLAFVAFALLPATFGDGEDVELGKVLGVLAWALVLGALGEGLRVRRERLREASAVRAQEERRRISDERLRISRELHDVLAHNVSLINVQSSVALHLIDEQPEQAREALAAIKQASAATLRDMRGVLGALRESDEALPRSPAPSLERLDALVDQVRQAGLDVDLEVTGSPRPLSAGVDLAAYRIVQEALTNVARHAAGARARVRLRYEPEAIDVQVDDDGPGPGRWDASRHGNGITGMGERAAALGGSLEAGPAADGGFRVHARLPAPALEAAR